WPLTTMPERTAMHEMVTGKSVGGKRSIPSSTAAISTTSSAIATSSTTAAEAPAAALRLRAGLVDVQCSAIHLFPVDGVYSTIPFRIIGHFDERKPTGLAAVPVSDDVHTINIAVSFK